MQQNINETILNRATKLGYTGTASEVMEQLAKDWKQLNNEEDKLLFAEKIAGKFNMNQFIEHARQN